MTEEKKDDPSTKTDDEEISISGELDTATSQAGEIVGPEVEFEEAAGGGAGPSDGISGGLSAPLFIVPTKRVDTGVALRLYVDICKKYAVKGKLRIPPQGLMNEDASMIDNTVLLWIFQHREGTRVQFQFCTSDDIYTIIQENDIDISDSDRLAQFENEIIRFLAKERGERTSQMIH